MMSKFIELHDKYTNDSMPKGWELDDRLYVNVDDISLFSKDGLWLRNSSKIECKESYDELKQLIQDAGILIHKPDPRLDTTTPLTIDDLKYMEGEPIWDSNSLKWMIIHRFVNVDKPVVWLVKGDGMFKVMTVDDLIKFPLYRMRQ